MKDTVIFDLDGTLCDITHRLPFIQGKKKDWDGFNAHCIFDPVREDMARLLSVFHRDPHIGAVICTGRSAAYRAQTEFWLKTHTLFYERLLMRPEGDYTSDTDIKPLLLSGSGLSPDRVLMIVEDRDRMVKRWRELGYTCLQCTEGMY